MSNRVAKYLDNANATPEDSAKPKSKRLVGNDQAKSQDFVLNTQEVAAAEGFRNVSKRWYDKTHPFSYAHEEIAKGRAETEDINATLEEMTPIITNDDKIGFQYQDSRVFIPTAYALAQIATRADVSTTINAYFKPKLNPNGSVKYDRDRGDVEVVLHMLQNGLREGRVDHEKEFLWRCNNSDMSLRAMLTDQYAILDNDWLLSVFEKAIPTARISHFKGDSDTFYCNLLIPDTIREESDSDYGAMVSTGNSEIGDGKSRAVPGLFRGICWNSNVWGYIEGEGLCKVHKGKSIDLFDLERQIIEGLNEQIPLIPQGIDKLLNTRTLAWDGASIRPIIAQVSKAYSLDKRQATEVLKGYRTEVNETSVNRNTLFGIINGVTRAAQEFDNPRVWDRLNTIGGTLMDISTDRWEGLVKTAKSLKVKEVEAMFSEN